MVSIGWDMSPVSNGVWLGEGHGDSRGLCYVESSIRIVGGTVMRSVRDRCASGCSEANMAREVFPISLIRPRRDTREGVSDGVSVIMVDGLLWSISI